MLHCQCIQATFHAWSTLHTSHTTWCSCTRTETQFPPLTFSPTSGLTFHLSLNSSSTFVIYRSNYLKFGNFPSTSSPDTPTASRVALVKRRRKVASSLSHDSQPSQQPSAGLNSRVRTRARRYHLESQSRPKEFCEFRSRNSWDGCHQDGLSLHAWLSVAHHGCCS